MTRTSPGIGARRLRVVLEEPVDVPDDIGGVTRSFQPRIALWARLEPGVAREQAVAMQPGEAITHRLSLRWRGDVTGAMRFVAGGRVFDVRAQFDPDGRRRTLVCLVEEVRP